MLQPSEEIKQKIDIVDLIREYVPIKPAGLNFRGACPFHREKTPSFMVSPEKQIWHCFGCGKGGDIFSFIMEIENVEFAEALRILAPKAGVVLRKQDPKLTSQKNRVSDIMELARRFYHKNLLENREAASAREYLKKRGIDDEIIEEWQIGYSPDSWDITINLLRKNGFRDEEIFAAGLSVKGNNRPGYYDRFRGRIMFPINETNGQTVGFSARVSPEKENSETMGKYINSPQTVIYDKSKILYGLDKAKPAIKKEDAVIIVEGQMDVITSHQFGYKNTVASSGTALTSDQVELLIKRYTKNFIFALDADSAGQTAVDRGVDTAKRIDYHEIDGEDSRGKKLKFIDPLLSNSINIKIIEIPAGKDPDESIRKNPGGWSEAIAKAKPIMEYYFDKETGGKDLEKVENKREVTRVLLGKIAKLADKIEQDFWLKKLAEKIDVAENILRETLYAHLKKTKKEIYSGQDKEIKAETKKNSREERISELTIALMLKFPALIEYGVNHCQIYYLVGDNNQLLYKNLLFYYNNIKDNNDLLDLEKGSFFDYFNFRGWLSEETGSDKNDLIMLPELLDKLSILGDSEFFELSIEQAKGEIIKYILNLKKNYLVCRMGELEKLIANYEKEKDTDMVKELLTEFKSLSDEIRDVNSN